jgi:hypothetical protein
LRDCFVIDRPRAERRMPLLKEMSLLAALCITCHPKAVPRLAFILPTLEGGSLSRAVSPVIRTSDLYSTVWLNTQVDEWATVKYGYFRNITSRQYQRAKWNSVWEQCISNLTKSWESEEASYYCSSLLLLNIIISLLLVSVTFQGQGLETKFKINAGWLIVDFLLVYEAAWEAVAFGLGIAIPVSRFLRTRIFTVP